MEELEMVGSTYWQAITINVLDSTNHGTNRTPRTSSEKRLKNVAVNYFIKD